MFILQTKNLTKNFGGVGAVNNLSIDFEKGKITSVIGPNGSGKTTLTNLLSGTLPFSSGSIVVNGEQLNKVKSHEIANLGITRTFQEVRLIEQMSALDNVLLVTTNRYVFSALFEKHNKQHLKLAENVLRKVNLWEKRNMLAGELSYGQRKLLEIARVLAVKADIYLLDEPFAGVFKEIVKIIVEVIQELRTQGKTIILIEHNMELIRKLSDHLIIMDAGKLLAHGKPQQVLIRKDVIEAYLGE